MVANPMQRKVRNSFLIGMLVMLLVAVLIGAILFFIIFKPVMDEQKAKEAETYVSVYKLKTNVESGAEITSGMLELVTLPTTSVPADKIIASNDGQTLIPFAGGKSKIDLTSGTILSYGLLMEEEELDNSLRLVEYNMITLPVTVDIGEYIDIRLSFPNGQDLIVVSKKEVIDLQENTISLYLTESEILMMNSAIVEAYIMTASNLYVARYTEPGVQTASIPTYVPTTEVQNLIRVNSNITSEARQALSNRFDQTLRNDYIQNQINQYSNESLTNIETGIQEQIEAARTARENYLSEMTGY